MRTLPLLLFLVLSVFVSCKKKIETPPEPTLADKLMEKEWQGEMIKINATPPAPAAPINQELPLIGARLNFKSDKTFTVKLTEAAEPQTGNWEMLENYTKLKLTGGFTTALNGIINTNIANIPLPAGTSITSIVIPEIFDIKTLNDTNLGFKGIVVVNLAVTAGPFTIPIPFNVNTEFFFKR